MAEDYRWFDVAEVMDRIKGKLVRRHPHVFGDAKAGDSRAVERSWETIKASEKGGTTGSVGEGIPATSPALSRAYRLGERAARVGFDWPETESIFEKLSEEKGELEAEMALLRKAKSDDERACLKVRLEEELGDIIFVLTNLSRRLGVDPEVALNGCNRRFIKRFDRMVAMIAEEKKDLAAMSIEEMDLAWKKAKKAVG
jgi:MazG family protein